MDRTEALLLADKLDAICHKFNTEYRKTKKSLLNNYPEIKAEEGTIGTYSHTYTFIPEIKNMRTVEKEIRQLISLLRDNS